MGLKHVGAVAILSAIAAWGGCGGSTPAGDGGSDAGAGWSTVFEDLDKVVLSVWGTSGNDVYFAGGGMLTPGREGPLALHFNGESWRNLDASAAGTATLWWVGGRSSTDVWFVGEQGVALRRNGQAMTRIETGTDATLYGVYAAGENDVWAVGGTPGRVTGDKDVILHWTGGASFEKVEPPMRAGIAYYKISGTGPNDIYASGEGGTILHYDGTGWSQEPTPTTALLFTVAAAGPYVMAVGTGQPPLVIERKNGEWVAVDEVEIGSGANGVAVREGGDAMVVGLAGTKWRRQAGRWIDETFEKPGRDLHATWFDPDGKIFAVGGNFLSVSSPMRYGVIAHHGGVLPSTRPTGP